MVKMENKHYPAINIVGPLMVERVQITSWNSIESLVGPNPHILGESLMEKRRTSRSKPQHKAFSAGTRCGWFALGTVLCWIHIWDKPSTSLSVNSMSLTLFVSGLGLAWRWCWISWASDLKLASIPKMLAVLWEHWGCGSIILKIWCCAPEGAVAKGTNDCDRCPILVKRTKEKHM